MNVLVVYDSKTGHTEQMANAIAKGAHNAGAQTKVKRAENATDTDLLEADGVILGSPTYFGQVSSKMKHFIDDSISVHTKLSGKVGAAFTSSGGNASGAETTLMESM